MIECNKEIAQIFKALSDEHRVEIIKLLQRGDMCACNISDNLNLSQSKLSYHMKILCESKIVESWNEGKWTHYKISKKGGEEAVLIAKDLTKVNKTNKNYSCLE